MAAIEKLIVQLFDRKRQIVQQLHHQKQLYDQHLLSKLLIQGIPPPAWLLRDSRDLGELNKEELISGLLLPRPGPLTSYASGPCFLYDKPVATVSNNGIPDETCATRCASSNGFDDGFGSVPPPLIHETEDTAGIVPPSDVDARVDTHSYVPMSPEDQNCARISGTYSRPAQSIVRIERSRSRQKALELRSSAKASVKSRLGIDDDVGISSGSKTYRHNEQDNLLRESLELVGLRTQSTDDKPKEVQRGDDKMEERKSSVYSGRVTRSRSSAQQSEGFSSRRKTCDYNEQHDGLSGCFGRVKPSSLPSEIWSEEAAVIWNGSNNEKISNAGADNDVEQGDDRMKDRKSIDYSGRVTRSRGCSQQSDGICSGINTCDYNEQLVGISGSIELVKPFASPTEICLNKEISGDSCKGSLSKKVDQNVNSPHNRQPEMTPLMKHQEDKVSLKTSVIIPSTCEHKQMSESSLLDVQESIIVDTSDHVLEEGMVKADQECAIVCSGNVSDGLVKGQVDSEYNSAEQLTVTAMEVDGRKSLQTGNKLKFPIMSPLIEPMVVTEADKTIPEFKGFRSQDIEDELVDEAMPLLSNILDPPSLHEQLCESACLSTAIVDPSDRDLEKGMVKADLECSIVCSGSVSDGLVKGQVDNDGNSSEQLTVTAMDVDDRKSLQTGKRCKLSIMSPLMEPMDVTEADRTMPEFEGFCVQDFGDEVVHEAMPLLCNILNPPSLHEQLCNSACSSTPVSPFPSACRVVLEPGIYSSVPNGLLENIDLNSSLLLDRKALQGKSHSDLFCFPHGKFGWDERNPFFSPVGKGIESSSSKSGCSDKVGSGNPELTCFTILEDPESCEEDVNEEDSTGVQRTNTNKRSSPIREPLCDITMQKQSSLAPRHAIVRGSLESVTTEMRVSEMLNVESKKSVMGQKRSGRVTRVKENKGLSVGGNSSKKQSKTLSSRFSKPKLSGQSSLRSRRQRTSDQEPKRNNIVSNVKSFIPLVQQKQAAAAAPAKRDVKVKALEAAEAAKRLAEKKENERKQKNEALKLERARLEQENLKQMELAKKLKAEAKKKREAENAAKKRQREEEEKQEKERKRKRVEEARCQQKQAENKINAWREESRYKAEDVKAHERKEHNKKIHKELDGANEENHSKKPVNELAVEGDERIEAADGFPALNDPKISVGSSDIGKVSSIVGTVSLTPSSDKHAKPINRASQESYDISPYQCSDDEEEEEDEIPTKKRIPTWASKNCVMLAMSSLKDLDPDTIFPPGSFCNLEEENYRKNKTLARGTDE